MSTNPVRCACWVLALHLLQGQVAMSMAMEMAPAPPRPVVETPLGDHPDLHAVTRTAKAAAIMTRRCLLPASAEDGVVGHSTSASCCVMLVQSDRMTAIASRFAATYPSPVGLTTYQDAPPFHPPKSPASDRGWS